MHSFKLVAVLIPLLFALGCKRAKPTEPTNTEVASIKPQPAPNAKNDKKTDKEPEPNWVQTPLGGKKDQAQLPVDTPVKSGQLPSVALPPANSGQPVQPMPGTGALQPNPAPNKPPATSGAPAGISTKTVTKDDMFHIQIFVHDTSVATGKMPPGALTYAALIKADSPAAKLVAEGAIILPKAPEREGVWAYETNAYFNGGLVVTQNGVETLTAAELKRRLGK